MRISPDNPDGTGADFEASNGLYFMSTKFISLNVRHFTLSMSIFIILLNDKFVTRISKDFCRF